MRRAPWHNMGISDLLLRVYTTVTEQDGRNRTRGRWKHVSADQNNIIASSSYCTYSRSNARNVYAVANVLKTALRYANADQTHPRDTYNNNYLGTIL